MSGPFSGTPGFWQTGGGAAMRLDMVEYVLLRLIRRYLVPEWLLKRIWNAVPYYQRSIGEDAPEKIVRHYWSLFDENGIQGEGKTICEAGVGVANGTLYEMIGRGAQSAIGVEPFAGFSFEIDEMLIYRTLKRYPVFEKEMIQQRVRRVKEFDELEDNSVDCIVSNSVIEHVENPNRFFKSMAAVLKPGGVMLHVVDYRDHFFKYPYHFLLFSPRIWNNVIGPRDLYRFRISDHIAAMRAAGLTVSISREKHNPEAFERVRSRIHTSFKAYSESDLSTIQAVLIGRKEIS